MIRQRDGDRDVSLHRREVRHGWNARRDVRYTGHGRLHGREQSAQAIGSGCEGTESGVRIGPYQWTWRGSRSAGSIFRGGCEFELLRRSDGGCESAHINYSCGWLIGGRHYNVVSRVVVEDGISTSIGG